MGAPDDRARRDGAARVRALWTAAGADKLLDVEPAVHDRAVTFASHLPYLAAAAVVDALLSAGDVVPLARELESITLLDVYEAVEPGPLFAMHRATPDQGCVVGYGIRPAILRHS